MSHLRRQVRVRYEGDVQGVGFRYVARNLANALGATGGVENLGDRLYREHLDPIAANQLRSLTGEGSIPVLFRPGTNFFFNVQYKY